jgi:hypothetical protein
MLDPLERRGRLRGSTWAIAGVCLRRSRPP